MNLLKHYETKFSDILHLAATVYGEARGEKATGKFAVAWSVINRVNKKSWYGKDLKGVVKKPYQYSCWNASDPNSIEVERIASGNEESLNNPVVQECIGVSILALSGAIEDPTLNSTHYHTKAIMPTWAIKKRPAVEIGNHVFYNNVT